MHLFYYIFIKYQSLSLKNENMKICKWAFIKVVIYTCKVIMTTTFVNKSISYH